MPAPIDVYVLGHTIHVTQTGAPPAAPEVSALIVDGRAVVSWTVRTGAAPTRFLVRGGVRGGAMVPLVTVFPEIRSWTSDPLLPGSYAVDVVAGNFGGESVPSNRVEWSVGATTTPEAPVNVTATSADDVVGLSWSVAPGGPAPSGYLIEAAPSGAVAFVPVLRVESTHAYASSVPPGTWQVRVRALTAAGASEPSTSVTVTSVPCTALPGPPTDLQLMPVAGVVTLRWNAPASGGVHEYIIEAGRTSGTGGSVRIPVSGSSRVYEIPAPNGIYSARLRARNACGESAVSNEVLAYIP